MTDTATSSAPARSSRPLTAASPAPGEADLTWRALKWCQLFSRWPDERLRPLQAAARLVRYSKRTLVLSHDQACRELLCVVSGCLEVSCVNEAGSKYLNALIGPRQLVPLVRLLQDTPLAYSYHALLDSTILHLPVHAITAQLDAEPLLWKGVAQLALQRQRNSLGLLQQQLLSNNHQRLASTLVELAQVYGRSGGAHDGEHAILINQTDLAAMLGVTRQTVNKELGLLTSQGIVNVSYGRIVVRDMARLRACTR